LTPIKLLSTDPPGSFGAVVDDVRVEEAPGDCNANGGVDLDPTPNTIIFNVTPVNDLPTATNLSTAETYTEDMALNLTDIVITDPDSAVTATVTLSNTAAGNLSTGTSGAVTSIYNASTGVWTASGALADVNTLLAGLTFTPTLNFNGNFTIATSVSDGVAAAITGSKAMTGIAVNDAPAGTDKTITINEDTSYTFGLEDFGFTDLLDNPANSFQAVTITTLPGAGTLTLNGTPVNAGDSIAIPSAGMTWTARESNRNWDSVASSADGTKLVAAAYGGQLYTSTDAGVTWTARENSRFWYSVASSADGMKLVAAAWNGQLYTSTDAGVTWTAHESNRAWRSVVSSADGTKLVAAVVNGQLYTSTDAGVTWTARESNRNWDSVASSAEGTKLVAAA
jgi:hypothetical protein